MLPTWVLANLEQDTTTADELSQQAPAELIDIVLSSNNLSTFRILRYVTSGSGGPENINNRSHAADIAIFCAKYSGGRALDCFFLRRRLRAYINELEGQAKGCLPPAKDVSRALVDENRDFERTAINDRCHYSPFAACGLKVVAGDYENLWLLCVKSPHSKSDKEEDATRLIKIRDCTPRRYCCWACRVRNDLGTSKRRQFKPTMNGALLDRNHKNETARPRRILEIQRKADAKDLLCECWPEKKVEHDESIDPDQRPVLGQRRRRYGRPRRRQEEPLRNGLKVCVSCNVSLHECDGRRPTCTPCSKDGYKCIYYPKGGEAIWPKPKPFKKSPSKLNKVETADLIETQYALGEESAKHLPPWTRTERFAPSYFIQTEFANEVFSPERSRRFVRLRRRQTVKPPLQKSILRGMPCMYEKCLGTRWSELRPEAEATPKRTSLDPFFSSKKASYRRWEKSRLARIRARQASGFAKRIAGPSKLRNEISDGEGEGLNAEIGTDPVYDALDSKTEGGFGECSMRRLKRLGAT